MLHEEYFHLRDISKLEVHSWIPLRQIKLVAPDVKDPAIVRLEEWTGIATAAVSADKGKDAERLGWSDLGVDPHRAVVEDRGYRSADLFQEWTGEVLGVNLVIAQFIPEVGHEIWYLNPDLVVALRLVQEGDAWYRPAEGWTEVVRLTKDAEGKPTLIEIRKEFLCDYLSARGMDLYCSSYRERTMVTTTEPAYSFDDRPLQTHEGETRETVSSSGSYPDPIGSFITRGALWRTEWVQGGSVSLRVRGDKEVHTATFTLESNGGRVSGPSLAGARSWVYFDPAVAGALLRRRGSKLYWYSNETGALGANEAVHFGINHLGFITVYAKDIGLLPHWEQRLWSAYNVTPDGGVATELFAAQMMVQPASTIAPETRIEEAIEQLNSVFTTKFGRPLLRTHDSVPALLRRLHRFQAVEPDGLLELAKDATRLFVERLDVDAIAAQLSLTKGEKRPGSLKLLETLLAGFSTEAEAQKTMAPLFGIYDLRLADAHLGSSRIDSGLSRAGVDTKLPSPMQGRQLLENFNATLLRLSSMLDQRASSPA